MLVCCWENPSSVESRTEGCSHAAQGKALSTRSKPGLRKALNWQLQWDDNNMNKMIRAGRMVDKGRCQLQVGVEERTNKWLLFLYCWLVMMTRPETLMMVMTTMTIPPQYDGPASCVPYTSCGPFGLMLSNLRKPFPNVGWCWCWCWCWFPIVIALFRQYPWSWRRCTHVEKTPHWVFQSPR